MTVVTAVTAWPTNADMILDVVQLGYIREDDRVLDPTYGRGRWWTKYKPSNFVAHDKYTLDGVDFRHLPYNDGQFDVVAYDPPYTAPGGRTTSTLGVSPNGKGSDFHDRYGLVNVPESPKETQQLINDGLTELARVVKPKGYILTKCQDYVSSGKLWNGTYLTQKHAIEVLGLIKADHLLHVAGIRPQPAGRRQLHARRNGSDLLVFQKGTK